ncbi:hypothetical protein [Salinimicrobium terrae]|uniref:hypothetical protein n=1 Tax=Salinimicrobium terrae TaxID=470866 RepID=UPI0003FC9C4A|nr:hypothetical protein [Salinimicrobium terrae]
MSIYNNIIKFLEQPEEETRDRAPEGVCAMCWGYQAYDKKIRKVIEDKQVDVNNHRFKYMRIQKLLKEQIEGIRLKKGKINDCPTCGGERNKK